MHSRVHYDGNIASLHYLNPTLYNSAQSKSKWYPVRPQEHVPVQCTTWFLDWKSEILLRAVCRAKIQHKKRLPMSPDEGQKIELEGQILEILLTDIYMSSV